MIRLTEPPVIPDQYHSTVLYALRAVYNAITWHAREDFGITDLPLFTHEELFLCPVADTLADIARAAAGELQHDEVGDGILRESIQSIAEMLFATPLTNSYEIPVAFWDSDLGQMLARAQLWIEGDELITIAEAARIRGVSVQAISQSVDAGRLRAYVDPNAGHRQGRRLVRRQQVEDLD
jgi:hypothetical protein